MKEMPFSFLWYAGTSITANKWQNELEFLESTFDGNGLYWQSHVTWQPPIIIRRIVHKLDQEEFLRRYVKITKTYSDSSLVSVEDEEEMEEAEDCVALLKVLQFYDALKVFPNLFLSHSANQFLRICVMPINSLKYTRDDERVRIPLSRENQPARQAVSMHYCAK